MKDYSQNGEQQVILAAFPGKTDGRFLDIGAYHAFDYSNTRALYELGWSGVMVEPGPSQMAGLVREYGNDPRIKLIQAAVGLDAGLVEIHASDVTLSTTKQAFYEGAIKAGYSYFGSLWVWQLSLVNVVYSIPELWPIDFFSIDVEGGSAELAIKWLNIANHTKLPHCMIVEHDFRANEIARFGARRGYRVALENGENIVLVRDK